jgi:hypothetical protein
MCDILQSAILLNYAEVFLKMPDPVNMVVAVGISLVTCLQAELCVLPVSDPPHWISNFRLQISFSEFPVGP